MERQPNSQGIHPTSPPTKDTGNRGPHPRQQTPAHTPRALSHQSTPTSAAGPSETPIGPQGPPTLETPQALHRNTRQQAKDTSPKPSAPPVRTTRSGCKRRPVFSKTNKPSGKFSHTKRQNPAHCFGNLCLKITGKKIQKIRGSRPHQGTRQTPRGGAQPGPPLQGPQGGPSSRGPQGPSWCVGHRDPRRGATQGENGARLWVKSCPGRGRQLPQRRTRPALKARSGGK